MKPYWEKKGNRIFLGDVDETLKSLADKLVQCVITSPPYWGLRDYDLPPTIWDSTSSNICERGCDHEWGKEILLKQKSNWDTFDDYNTDGKPRVGTGKKNEGKGGLQGQFCTHCNAWRGCLGLEPTYELYIQHMVLIFREVRRVLRDDGTLWLNMGDSYNGSGPSGGPGKQYTNKGSQDTTVKKVKSLKSKDLIGVPWHLAFALQADGWYLRSAMPWVKRSAMPESVRDRPASALEYMFLFSKSQKYFFDMEAIRIDLQDSSRKRMRSGWHGNEQRDFKGGGPQNHLSKYIGSAKAKESTGRNFRNTDFFYQSVTPPHGMIFCEDEPVGLDVNPQAMKEAHFATFPEKLVEPCLLAGTSEYGCCSECGKPLERVTEKEYGNDDSSTNHIAGGDASIGVGWEGVQRRADVISRAIGWKPGCDCTIQDKYTDGSYARSESTPPSTPCTVLDPFLGSATVGKVAIENNLKFIGIELSQTYLDDIVIPRVNRTSKRINRMIIKPWVKATPKSKKGLNF